MEKVPRDQITLHSDNGSPMKGATMLVTLQKLGVMPSFSRPSVSNDNAFSESLFRTLKYRPQYPQRPFADCDQARDWVSTFVDWYNGKHKHSTQQSIRKANASLMKTVVAVCSSNTNSCSSKRATKQGK